MNLTRREAAKQLALAALIPTAVLGGRQARGAEPARLEVKDPAAIAQAYVENAAQVDLKQYPQYVPGSNCENCLQLQGTPGNTYRPCSLFPGKLVSVSGWCKSWTPEM
jgi:hypothetical protein